MTYQEFLETKIEIAKKSGFPIDEKEINPHLAADDDVETPTLFDYLDMIG